MVKSKTVLITGASRGIGRACALKFAHLGHRVIINYNKSEAAAAELVRTISDFGGYAEAFACDISDFSAVSAMFELINKRFGGVDILINNAGIAKTMLFGDMSENDWDNIFGVNVKGMFNTVHCALPYMLKNKSGKIVNISSIWGICGASCEVAYSASKAAVIGFTKALASELGPSGICVNCVAPGVIDTDMNSNLSEEDKCALIEQTPQRRLGNAEDVANAVCFLSGDEADFITGQVLSPNGGFVF